MKNLNLALSKEKFKKLRNDLHNFFAEHPVLFRSLFQENELIEYKGNHLNSLFEFDIVSKVDDLWSSNYSVYQFEQLYFFTDSFLLPQIDRVFPLSQDESMFLASKINVNEGDTVLDIGTGSGIYAIAASRKGANVTAVDINHKSLNYASFNSLLNLNHVEGKIEFLSNDVFANMGYKKFDYIISNPAVIPTAENSGFYIHSDGGIDGTKMSLKILEHFPEYLLPGGKLQMLATSFSTKKGKMFVEEFIRNHHSGRKLRFTIQELYTPSLNSLTSLTCYFKGSEGYNKFIHYLNEQNYSSLCYLYIIAEEGLPFEIVWSEKDTDFVQTEHNGSWTGRLNRLFMVYPKIPMRKFQEKVIH